ncbi:arsenate reductase (glutaredoxin) [Ottowia sp.]|uniref:arsenate reductase (glutaredoxin) n=1 Tax=Ottowia sp. TaxID=1898956 RepID=UPI003A85C274
MRTTTIYHNPQCSTSRKVLAAIRDAGVEPHIIEYLKTPPTADELKALACATGEPLRRLIRTKQPEYLAQGLDNPQLSDDQLAQALSATPVLIERPIVVSPLGTRLARPAERVQDILPPATG